MYKIQKLLKYKNLVHAFSEKSDGNMANVISGKVFDPKKVLENRSSFLKKAGVDINGTSCMWVMHGDKIIETPEESVGKSMFDYNYAVKADGLITNKKGLYLFLLIADCIPLIIYDPLREAVGLIHAGWKGVDLEIARKAVEKFKSKYKSEARYLVVSIGPCARKESFIKYKPQQLNDPKWKGFIADVGDGNYQVDLVGFTKKQLLDEGVLEENIFDCGIDTVKDKRFFSYCREGSLLIEKQGRFAGILGLQA